MDHLDVFIWQGEGSEGPRLPEAFRPVSVTAADLPVAAPVLVPLNGFDSFVRAAGAHALERPPDAILYLKAGEEKPEGAFAFFDAFVREGEWERLAQYARHPRYFESAEWAAELDPETADRLPHPLGPEDVRALPLPAAIRDLLAGDAVYRRAFGEAVDEERAFRWRHRDPTTHELAAYVRGQLSAAVEPYIQSYLARSAAGRAQFAVLQRELLGASALDIAVADARRATEELDEAAFTRLPIALRILALSLFAGRVRLRAGQRYRDDPGPGPPPLPEHDAADLLAALTAPGGATLGNDALQFDVRYEPETESLRIERLAVGREARTFFVVELSRDDATLWRRPSTKGAARIPLGEVRSLFEQGALRLRILTSNRVS